ncbi:glycosyltransferase [Candidatus Woesearchaeota archaeon]|nr:glycosyltransferase [Candidatus Woesearchaeota archaeon]
MKKKISVIIPTYNRIKKLERCINSILSQRYAKKMYEIIIIDDGGSDGTKIFAGNLIKKYDNIKIITNKSNKGPAYSRNIGIKNARGDIIALTDDDCVVNKDWLKQIDFSHKKNSNEFAIGGRILGSNPDTIFHKFRDFVTEYTLKRSLIKKNNYNYMPTCNISYKKDVFKKIGYFDESFKLASGEDVDINLRLLKIGKSVYLDKKILVYHDYPMSVKGLIKKSYSYGLYIPLIRKNHPKLNLFVPKNIYSTILFLVAFPISISSKIFSVNGLINKFKLFPYIIIDELAFRFGVTIGLYKLKYKN